jgi:hypothetical protein
VPSLDASSFVGVSIGQRSRGDRRDPDPDLRRRFNDGLYGADFLPAVVVSASGASISLAAQIRTPQVPLKVLVN